MKTAYPAAADLTARLTGLGVTLPAGVDATDLIQGAIERWENETLWSPFLAEDTADDYEVQPSGEHVVRLPFGFVDISAVKLDGSPYVLNSEVYLKPVGALQRNRPYSRLEFVARCPAPIDGVPGALVVTGKRGYSVKISNQVWLGILDLAVAMGLRQVLNAPGTAKSIKQDTVTLDFGMAPVLIDRLEAQFTSQVMNYVRRG